MKTIFFLLSLSFLYISCKKEYSCEKCIPITLPDVSTDSVTDISQTSAEFHGTLLKIGDTSVSDFGFCWATTSNPTINNNKVSNGLTNTKQSFSNVVIGLLPNQTYYVRAFAKNSLGTAYSEELNFTTLNSISPDTSLYFDGVYINNTGDFNNDHVDISPNGPMSTISATTSYTIEAWVKRTIINNTNGLERIYSKDNIFQFRVFNNNFEAEIGSASVQTAYPADTLWHHLAFVRDKSSNTLKLFIDGQLKVSIADNSSSLNNNGAIVCIGARNNGNGIYELWKGNIRYLRVSNVARYNSSFTSAHRYDADTNTLALWPFSEGTGTVLHDVSGHNYNGNIVNATWVIN